MTRPTDSDIVMVRLRENYPEGLQPQHSPEFPTSATPPGSSNRVFYAVRKGDEYRLIVRKREVAGDDEFDERGREFYDDTTNPEGWVGWNVDAKYVEVMNMATYAASASANTANVSFTIEATTTVQGVPDGIRCQYKLGKPNQCLEEATWIIHLDPMECGHPDPRSNHHRYCDEHFWNKLQYIATNRAITECTECGDAKRSRPRFIGVEKL